jgi:hypothetical protein
MNAAQRRMTGCALVGGALLVLLALLCRYAFREIPPEPTTARTESSIPERPRRAKSVFPAEELPAEIPATQPPDVTVTNAATLYRQAFALYDALSKDEKMLLGYWPTNVDVAVESRLCEKIRPISELMHQATTMTNCDWGFERPLTRDKTFKRLLPILQSSRDLARAAMWSAAHCRSDDASQAVNDVVATSRLGQSLPPLVIGYLVDLAIQGIAMDFVAKHARTFAPHNDDNQFAQVFESSQFDEGFCRAFDGEAEVSTQPLRALTEEERRDFVAMFPQAQSIDLNRLNECIHQADNWRTQYGKALQLTEADYQDWLAGLHEAEKSNPILESLASNWEATVEKTRRATIMSAMVSAGLAVMRDGQNALQMHTDPATGQPFVYEETSGGFELQSGYEITNGVPLKMQFK